jgi:transposase
LKENIGYRNLAKKYNTPGSKQIETWVAAFQRLGTEGISRSRQKKSYSFQFKLHTVEVISKYRDFLQRFSIANRNQ